MGRTRELAPELQKLTEHNKLALQYYREACRILSLPKIMRAAEIGDDERLKNEVLRLWRLRNNADVLLQSKRR